MKVVQLIEVETENIDEMLAEAETWLTETEGTRAQIVFFDSFESAMENSELPDTQRFAEAIGSLTTSRTFRDLDVIDDRT